MHVVSMRCSITLWRRSRISSRISFFSSGAGAAGVIMNGGAGDPEMLSGNDVAQHRPGEISGLGDIGNVASGNLAQRKEARDEIVGR